jgi:mannose-1-phosphate guanylyltransferase/phosphomannomutase
MILAAGYGERMKPLTSTIPKTLLPVLGVPIFDLVVAKLTRAGCAEIHCNLFHLADAIESHARAAGSRVRFHGERELLGTGGGIGNMADSVKRFDAVILHNGDIVSSLEFEPALSFHERRKALVTLILVRSGPVANVVVKDGEVIGFVEKKQARGDRRQIEALDDSPLGHTGLAILSPDALGFFPRGGPAALVPILSEMIRQRPGSVAGYDASAATGIAWGEIGSPAGYLDIHRKILIDKVRFDPLLEPPPLALHAGAGAAVDPGARWRGFLEIGPRAAVRSGASLEDCILLEGTVVEGGEHREEIIFPGGVLSGKESRL